MTGEDRERNEPSKWLPAAIDMDKLSLSEAFSSLLRTFHYSTVLPERLKNVGAYASELVRESANWFVPASFRNSRSYSIFTQQMLDYVLREGDEANRREFNDNHLSGDASEPNEQVVFLARKTVSGLLDMTALGTFHISPLTVLAIYSDIAYESKIYLSHLAARLKEQRIIPHDSQITNSDQLVSALEKALGGTAGMFDQPLISINGIRKTIRETRATIKQVDPHQLLPLSEIDQMLRQMELAARMQGASIWDVSATISIVALNQIQCAGQSGLASLEMVDQMFQRHIIDHYWEGLRAIERQGLLPALSHASQPFLETFWNIYTIDQKTWTESIFNVDLIKWGWSRLSWSHLMRG
jgi:hypothetical protein